MKNKDIFDNLYVLDIANNHFGNLSHAKKIIDQFGKFIKKFKIKAALNFSLEI